MLLNIDIAKAYGMIECDVVLATLHLMNFPPVWINWIKACMSTARIAILVNGHVTSWFSSGRRLRHEDPRPLICSFLSHKTLIHVENAFKQNWIPGFDARLSVNFNHLMFFANLLN